jgi:hypothetical protein
MTDQNDMDKILTSMMEDICDHFCRFPWETEHKEDLEDICAECQMGQYVCDILNTYNAACQLQAAAGIVRSELMQKGDWHNALVVSIHGYFCEMDKPMAPWEVAKGLADRIVGIEPAN